MKIPKLSSPEASTGSSRAAVRAGRYGLDSLLDALAVAYIRAPRWGWVAPTLIVLLAGVLRFYNLAHPNAIVFDETYYAKDAYSYVHYGYELSWTKDANASFVAGHPSGILPDSPEYVVHPPLGKWMIAAGMAIFGDNNPFGWRVSAALIGTLSVALIAYAAWLLFRSVTVSTIAALLATVDGLMLVESRLALLDIFQMFWIMATFVCLLLDRIHARRVLARNIAEAARQHQGELPP
ncbi:MAG: phospholipid carrier-dependent glycosyltransferase, partial [Rothia mucilaginosa]|uniref:phospholipid carrier-dependent glycosyltransferase n=2 Tax=Rothia TaxID=32207 RepID=UPI001D36DDEA